MKSLLILVGAVLALLIYAPACSPGTAGAPTEVSCDDFMKLKNISGQVEEAAGSTITLKLCSNPSTGFEWTRQARISDNTIVRQLDQSYLAPGDTGTAGASGNTSVQEFVGRPGRSITKSPMGAPGKQIWTFKALEKGRSTVSLEYSQPWEGGEKVIWTYELAVIVK